MYLMNRRDIKLIKFSFACTLVSVRPHYSFLQPHSNNNEEVFHLKSILICFFMPKTISNNLTFFLREKRNCYCLLSLFCFVSSSSFSPLSSCLLCSGKHLIKNTISTTTGPVSSNQTVMGVYHVLSLTGI